MLDEKKIAAITKQVQRQFPEVSGSKPTVKAQNPPQAKSPGAGNNLPQTTFLVTFRGSAYSVSGKSIPRLVRVVVNADGKILKITTSR